jgi:peptidoglycan/LPS O-acetylase OafA/YrhL
MWQLRQKAAIARRRGADAIWTDTDFDPIRAQQICMSIPLPSQRLDSLDGLRGVAAFSVMMSHALWAHPSITEALRIGGDRGPAWVRVLTYTPCHLPWLAWEAVIVFFILSGFVLTRPYLLGAAQSYRRYYASRFIRLLLPCWAAVGFAYLAGQTLYLASPPPIQSSWLQLYSTAPPLSASLPYALLVNGVPPGLPPLWSLRWEILFSLALPAYVLIARSFRSTAAAVVLGAFCLFLISVGLAAKNEFLELMPVFLLGAMVNSFVSRPDGNTQSTATAPLVVGCLLMVGCEWYARGVTGSLPVLGVARLLAVCGGVGVVYCAVANEAFSRLLQRPAILWLGRRSFSLYLVHFPVVIAAALPSAGENVLMTVGLGVPGSLIAAAFFYTFIELPSLRLAEQVKSCVVAV